MLESKRSRGSPVARIRSPAADAGHPKRPPRNARRPLASLLSVVHNRMGGSLSRDTRRRKGATKEKERREEGDGGWFTIDLG